MIFRNLKVMLVLSVAAMFVGCGSDLINKTIEDLTVDDTGTVTGEIDSTGNGAIGSDYAVSIPASTISGLKGGKVKIDVKEEKAESVFSDIEDAADDEDLNLADGETAVAASSFSIEDVVGEGETPSEAITFKKDISLALPSSKFGSAALPSFKSLSFDGCSIKFKAVIIDTVAKKKIGSLKLGKISLVKAAYVVNILTSQLETVFKSGYRIVLRGKVSCPTGSDGTTE